MSDALFIQLVGEEALLGLVADAIDQLEHPADLLDAIGARLEANIEERFDTRTDPNGAPWAPLSPATVAIYLRQYGGNIPGALLQRSRLMRASLARNVTDDYVEVGMSRQTSNGRWQVPLLHEFGTRRFGRQYMPRRGLLTADPQAGTLGAQDRADIEGIVQRLLQP